MISIIPDEFISLLKLLPEISKDTVDIKQLTKASLVTVKNLFSKRYANLLTDQLKRDLNKVPFVIINQTMKPTKLTTIDYHNILILYFIQILLCPTLSLDFRSKYFSSINHKLQWSPSVFSFRFSPSFIHAIRNLYKAFYCDDLLLFRESLENLGLLQNHLKTSEQDTLISLFYKHFSQSKKGKMKFRYEDYFTSFNNIFIFLSKNKIKVPYQFAYFGVYLATLYKCLENCEEEIDVKDCYLQAVNLAKLS